MGRKTGNGSKMNIPKLLLNYQNAGLKGPMIMGKGEENLPSIFLLIKKIEKGNKKSKRLLIK